MDVRTYLEQQQVHPQLIRAVEEFRNQYPVEEKVKYRVSDPMMPFYGTEIPCRAGNLFPDAGHCPDRLLLLHRLR